MYQLMSVIWQGTTSSLQQRGVGEAYIVSASRAVHIGTVVSVLTVLVTTNNQSGVSLLDVLVLLLLRKTEGVTVHRRLAGSFSLMCATARLQWRLPMH